MKFSLYSMKHLTNNQKQTLNNLEINIRKLFEVDKTGHDFGHIQRVVKLTTRLLVDDVNPFVTISIAYCHDLFDEKLDTPFQTFKEMKDAWKLDFETYDQEIEKGIFSLGYKGGFEKKVLSKEARLVYEADLLDAMGAIGIARTFYYAGSKQMPFHDENLEGVIAENIKDYRNKSRNTIAHFDEKLLKLKDEMKSEKAIEIANRRHKLLLEFKRAFEEEIKGDDI